MDALNYPNPTVEQVQGVMQQVSERWPAKAVAFWEVRKQKGDGADAYDADMADFRGRRRMLEVTRSQPTLTAASTLIIASPPSR